MENLDIDLHATTLMSHSKLLGAQLDCIQGKVSNLSLKVFKSEHVCACGKSSAKPLEDVSWLRRLRIIKEWGRVRSRHCSRPLRKRQS